MAGNMRIKINRAGVVALLTSPEVSADLTRRGNAIAAAAGDGVETQTARNRDRAVAFVRTETFEARKAEATDRSLTRAIDAGR
ncbi:hypothetical protein ACUOFU_16840 [Microbacterium arabinogalactanolyticum]|uniref:hypothetical protein n=1 Tax=Microbacterium arabinogalactanolyticum TaxID=69365 RepID=UPI00404408E1